MKKYNSQKKDEKIQHKGKNKWGYAIFLGVIGALFWSGIGYLAFWLNFSELSPSHFGKPFLNPNYLYKWEGILISLLIAVVLSVLFSLMYAYTLAHLYTPWIGVILGGCLWFLFLGWNKLDVNTFFTTLCLFLLYGVFIGFSLSAEFSNPEKKEK